MKLSPVVGARSLFGVAGALGELGDDQTCTLPGVMSGSFGGPVKLSEPSPDVGMGADDAGADAGVAPGVDGLGGGGLPANVPRIVWRISPDGSSIASRIAVIFPTASSIETRKAVNCGLWEKSSRSSTIAFMPVSIAGP
jgi:hypothetical protein